MTVGGMVRYIIHRILVMIPLVLAISVITFFIMQLPPGDFLTSYITQLAQSGEEVSQDQIASLRARYGLDRPWYVQYVVWMSRVVQGDFGFSFGWNRPVNQLIWERLGLTVAISVATLLFTWVVSFIIGFYSATRKNSIGDYFFSFLGFVGLATPNFMLALVLLWIAYAYFGTYLGGLFSAEYADAPWSWAKFLDLLNHLWIPIIVIGTAATAGAIRILRANLLDELSKPYVVTARAKGLSEFRLVLKYPVRIALIPFVSTIGWSLPLLISGEIIVAVVLNLPTTGPLLLRALLSQDMFVAGALLLLLSVLTVIGTLISDILLAWLDPRIRYS